MSSFLSDQAVDMLFMLSTGQLQAAAAQKYPGAAAMFGKSQGPARVDQMSISAPPRGEVGEPEAQPMGQLGEIGIQRGEGFEEPDRTVELDPFKIYSAGPPQKIGGLHGRKTKAQEDDWWVNHMSNTNYDPAHEPDELKPRPGLKQRAIAPGHVMPGSRTDIDETGKPTVDAG